MGEWAYCLKGPSCLQPLPPCCPQEGRLGGLFPILRLASLVTSPPDSCSSLLTPSAQPLRHLWRQGSPLPHSMAPAHSFLRADISLEPECTPLFLQQQELGHGHTPTAPAGPAGGRGPGCLSRVWEGVWAPGVRTDFGQTRTRDWTYLGSFYPFEPPLWGCHPLP